MRTGTFRALLGLAALALATPVCAGVLPEDRADLLYHSYDGGGVEIDGPSLLVRKSFLEKFSVSGNIRPALVLTAVKLFLMPAVALAVAVVAGLPPFTTKVVVMAAALPSGVNSYLIAAQFGTGQALASNQMTIATAAAVATTSLWLLVLHLLFG